MIRWLLVLPVFFFSVGLYAAEKPAGFLWYNIEQERKNPRKQKPGIPFRQLSFTDQDAVLHFYTLEALHKARNTKKVEDMREFLSLQDYWLKESSRFKKLFQKTMLQYPEYDYQVTHPTSNIGAKITDEVREARKIKKIAALSKSRGLLFFYRGKSSYDVKQIPILADFSQRFHLTLIPISVDGVVSSQLPQSRIDQGHANRLGVHYFPAILLVNPKTQSIRPVAYGLTTQDILMERL